MKETIKSKRGPLSMHTLNEQQRNEQINEIILSTGSVNKQYIVREVVFVTDRVEGDLFSKDTKTTDLFSGVCLQLKKLAFDYDANAVIDCVFEKSITEVNGVKTLEIFAYGTVVQFTPTTIG